MPGIRSVVNHFGRQFSSLFYTPFHFGIRQHFVTNFSSFSNPLPIIPTEPHTENIDMGVDADLPRMRTGRISQ